MLKKPHRIQSSDRIQNLIQDNLANAIDSIISNPITDSIILRDVSLSSGLNKIDHKMNRTLLGWVIVRINAAATVFENLANPLPDKRIWLDASANCKVDLLLF
jgi:hypothetical protein